jgi:hypothetical protein
MDWLSNNHDAIEAVSAIGAFVASAFLVVATVALWKATGRLATATEKLSEGAEQQITEMAKATDLAEKQFLMAGAQADLAAKVHGLERLQYLAEHRPRMAIRSVALASSGKGGFLFHGGFAPKGSLVIVNTGASEAKVLNTEYRFFWSNTGLPMVPPLGEGQTRPLLADVPHTMAGHESCLVAIEADNVLTADVAQSLSRGVPWKLYLMGAIHYQDADLKERWMGFCREYRAPETVGAGEGRFVPVDNPDYEYVD